MKHARPTQAVILAAGLATRLRPLTHRMPKACLPVWGRPAIHHVLAMLARWGVREALVNLHHEPLEVMETARAWKGPIRLSFSFEPLEPYGTGGALRHAAWFLRGKPFWLANADVMADTVPDPLLDAFHSPDRPLAALWMIPDAGPRTVALDNGRVADFHVPRPGAPGTVTFSGVHLVVPAVLEFLPAPQVSSIIDAYRNAMAAGRVIAGVTMPGYWDDIGVLADYLRAHGAIEQAWKRGAPGGRLYDPDACRIRRALKRSGVRIEGFAAVAPDAAIGRGAVLRDCVIWPGARVAEGSTIEQAVISREVTVRGPVRGLAVPARVLDPVAAGFLRDHGWDPDATAAIPLGPRGSDRAFARFQDRDKEAIFVRYGRERFENTLYAGHTRFLHGLGIRVPRLLAEDARRRMLLFEDCGRRDLLGALKGAPPRERLALYGPVVDLTARLHTEGTAASRHQRLRLVKRFSPALYRWERHYFAKHFLGQRLKLGLPDINRILTDLRRVARELEGLPRVLIHRDLQSSNVLLLEDQPVLIDYQGMRYGAAAYDVASLLGDPYVSLPAAEQLALLARYRKAAGADLPEPLFWTAAIQRLAQALGAFARLGSMPGTAGFAAHIPPAIAMMRRAVEHLGPGRFPHLAALLARGDLR